MHYSEGFPTATWKHVVLICSDPRLGAVVRLLLAVARILPETRRCSETPLRYRVHLLPKPKKFPEPYRCSTDFQGAPEAAKKNLAATTI